MWAYARGGDVGLLPVGRPTDHTFIEASNGRFRSRHGFLTLADEKEKAKKMEAWMRYYNEDRPHGAVAASGMAPIVSANWERSDQRAVVAR
jgi:putative transposase